ncbi:hypothetical protein [Hymenobacter sp. AT01-02]|uniref:hypothetical protein n=1 Tax=Hymenobacter sp. AT01-02 TaxID=1571877 RepID=UPI001F31842D|nr:hypothetical protein [Hymenobacter sp. AT01-02]
MTADSDLLPVSLLLNGREFFYADIQQYPANSPTDLNGYEARVLDFCRQWLNGAQEFGLRTSALPANRSPLQCRGGNWKLRPAARATTLTWAPATECWYA